MIKQWLRNWLGIQHLSDYVVLTRKELGLTESIATVVKVELANEVKPEIRKGYVKTQ